MGIDIKADPEKGTGFFPAFRDTFSRLQRLPNNGAIFDAVAVGVAYLAQCGAYQVKLSKVSADTPA